MVQYNLKLDDVVDAQITTEAMSSSLVDKGNIIRSALATYFYLRSQIKAGNNIVLVNSSGKTLGKLEI